MLGSDSFVFLTVFMFVILAKVKCGFLASFLKWQVLCCMWSNLQMVELSDDVRTMYRGVMMCYQNLCWFQRKLWNMLLRVGMMQHMCNGNKILVPAHLSPNHKSVLRLNVVIRCARDPPERFMWWFCMLYYVTYFYINYSCCKRSRPMYSLHTRLCTPLISLSNNPLESTSTWSQNITDSNIKGDRGSLPLICDDFTHEVWVKSLQDLAETRGCMIVLNRELDQQMVDTTICIW